MSPLDQKMTALAEANRRRSAAAVVKQEVADGLPLADALTDPRAAAVKVDALLACVRGLGPAKVARVLRRVGVSPAARVRDVTARQAKALAADPLVAGGPERAYDRARYVGRRAA